MPIAEAQLPDELSLLAAVEAAYPDELSRAGEALGRSLPVLIECDKGLVSFFYAALRNRLRRRQIRCVYIDGRVPPQPGQMPGVSLSGWGHPECKPAATAIAAALPPPV